MAAIITAFIYDRENGAVIGGGCCVIPHCRRAPSAHLKVQERVTMSGAVGPDGRFSAFSTPRQRRTPFGRLAAGDGSGDDDADNQEMLQIVSIWTNRLSLISVVTTFFAGMDGTFLGFTAPFNDDTTNTSQLVHASLAGALVFHLFAAIISYIASFALIRYQLVDAEGEEVTENTDPQQDTENIAASRKATHLNTFTKREAANLPQSESNAYSGVSAASTSSRIRVEQVRIFSFAKSKSKSPASSKKQEPRPPIALLLCVHTMCITLSSLGFALAVLGVMSYVWTSLARSVSIFTTVCLGISFAFLSITVLR
ncbi:hypothetical protein GLOTRDRAFT_129454 [Gloeophyllum trabeum ATCC 11539]|uniref:Transmembrane protein n=1 Tax=Gloeophyllum trabeum (strain ATCC 11539 / FP-39264 / Madison 617) TaxID=670483 RepID=S7Q6L5_GLOTA|nr:uncharacterized protein GLOTRDRAFT_129454 [Gloeophyllum trabeum ATCC 11539]EPQ55162.1 hypothetical protein GLOTRDRAFT_129454 [Gloeophyllum trabeum ATCC 11539]